MHFVCLSNLQIECFGILIIDSLTAYLLQGGYRANRIFYLSVPQEALLDVASSLANNAQTKKGWNRIIIEKPFGFDALSSQWFTKSLLSNFEEKQIYRCMHMHVVCPSMLTNCSNHYHIIYTLSSLYNLHQSYYRIDHLLGRNLIENLTVLRFSNLVFEPLWSRTYIHNVQVNSVSM